VSESDSVLNHHNGDRTGIIMPKKGEGSPDPCSTFQIGRSWWPSEQLQSYPGRFSPQGLWELDLWGSEKCRCFGHTMNKPSLLLGPPQIWMRMRMPVPWCRVHKHCRALLFPQSDSRELNISFELTMKIWFSSRYQLWPFQWEMNNSSLTPADLCRDLGNTWGLWWDRATIHP
jgi:hypothetical protein